MTQTRPHPEFWYPIVQVLVALRAFLRAAAPESFTAIARDARAQLAALTAMVRRYIHVLAAELGPPPHTTRPPLPDTPAARERARSSPYRFPLIERPARRSRSSAGEDPPDLQLALLLEAVQRLADVMADPAPHALRLARFLQRLTSEALRERPISWHVIRRIHPALDVLLIRLDASARPAAWEGLDTG